MRRRQIQKERHSQRRSQKQSPSANEFTSCFISKNKTFELKFRFLYKAVNRKTRKSCKSRIEIVTEASLANTCGQWYGDP